MLNSLKARFFESTQTLLLLVLLSVAVIRCKEDPASRPFSNQTPQSFLWLFPVPDTSIGTGVSRQHLRWWGEDPDGLVRGFLFAYASFPTTVRSIPNPDTLRYTFVTTNDTIISFPLDTLFRNYTVFIRSVDNTFDGIPHRSAVVLSPAQFWDRNPNGVLDGEDVELPDILEATDPVGAILTIPIRNTPPQVRFSNDPNEPAQPLKQPDTTYTVATFSWKATDADGDNTLASYRIALNDTSSPSSWLTLPLRDTVITLVVPRVRSDGADSIVDADVYGGRFLGRQLLGRVGGLRLDGLNRLFVQSRDVAGEYSMPITMPSGTDHWFVKRPRARLLLVSDYVSSDRAAALSTYLTALPAVPGTEYDTVDHLDIGLGLTPADKQAGRIGELVPPFIDPALIHTFLLYDVVLWYTDQIPSLGVAQLTLFTYLQNGGKVIFSTTFQFSADARGAFNDFAPIDSISSVDLTGANLPRVGDTRIPANYIVHPDSSDPGNAYPPLAFNPTPINHLIFMRPIYRRSDARYIYRLQSDTRVPLRYTGSPNIGVVDGLRSIVFVGLPLHLLNNTAQGNPEGITAFLTKALLQGFDPARRIRRNRF